MEVKLQQLRLWSESRGSRVIQFKIRLWGSDQFTLDAWIVESGEHVGVYSPHPHRSYFHLQHRRKNEAPADYRELPKGKPLRYYAQVFEEAVRKVFRVNAWKVFS